MKMRDADEWWPKIFFGYALGHQDGVIRDGETSDENSKTYW